MIPCKDQLEAAARLRSNVISLIGGVKDSPSGWMRFNDPSPNWLTSGRLKECLEDYETALVRLGAVRILLHAPCGSPLHESSAPNVYGHSGYWRYELAKDRRAPETVEHERIVVDGVPMQTVFDDAVAEQVSSTRPCPCQPDKKANEHSVSPYFLWPLGKDSRLGELAELTLTMRDAIQRSEDHKRRSGIRELLLQVLIKLDDLIVEEGVESVLLRRGVQVL